MNKINNFSDITYIINNRVDIKDEKGYKISFVRFMSYSLIEVTRLISAGNYTYDFRKN